MSFITAPVKTSCVLFKGNAVLGLLRNKFEPYEKDFTYLINNLFRLMWNFFHDDHNVFYYHKNFYIEFIVINHNSISFLQR